MMTQVQPQFTEPSVGVEWDVVEFGLDRYGNRRGDGDTVWLYRARIDRLGDHRFMIGDIDPVAVRLVWVDTPERGQEGYREAAADLTEWLDEAMEDGSLKVLIYEASAGWDRLLGNLINSEGESASAFLMTEKNWPAYEEDA